MARRRHEEEHENHERWLVSYADFITLLFAFFVVMYAISSVNEGKYRVLSDSMMQAFRSAVNQQGASTITPPTDTGSLVPVVVARPPPPDPEAERRRAAHAQRMRNMADQIRRVLAPLVSGGQVRVTEGVRGISVEINASVLFAPADASLGAAAVQALRAVGEVIATGDFPVVVEGHTDNSPINNSYFPSNWELSAVRASSVVRLFVSAGVRPARLTAAGYGDQRPVADNATPEGRARNRRVTILIESSLPAQDEPAPGAAPATDGALGIPAASAATPVQTGG
ncbi:MAG: flagellar motor protein MotD [Rhodocyclaceae bacterium]